MNSRSKLPGWEKT